MPAEKGHYVLRLLTYLLTVCGTYKLGMRHHAKAVMAHNNFILYLHYGPICIIMICDSKLCPSSVRAGGTAVIYAEMIASGCALY